MSNKLVRVAAAVSVTCGAIVALGWPVQAASSAISIVGSGTNGCASGFCYQPASTPINAGDSVTWTNNSASIHTITRCGAAAGQNDTGCPTIGAAGNDGVATDTFDSPTVSGGGTFSHSFAGGGSYTFYCRIHGYGTMHAVITVTAAAPAPGPSATASTAPAGAAAPGMPPSGSGPVINHSVDRLGLLLLGALSAATVGIGAARRRRPH